MLKATVSRWIKTVMAMGLAVAVVGCDDGGSSHDFGDNDPNLYVAMGDSITAGYGASTAWPAELSSMLGKTVVNTGISGSTSGSGAGRVGGVLSSYKPGYLLILYGVNDIIQGGSPEGVRANLAAMVQAAKANKTIPVLATLTPVYSDHAAFASGVDRTNEEIRSLADAEGVALVDLSGLSESKMQPDGLHPNNEGQKDIAGSFKSAL